MEDWTNTKNKVAVDASSMAKGQEAASNQRVSVNKPKQF